jgi:hypothetical protein
MRDGFTESMRFLSGRERLNDGPWSPVGTLAAETFVASALVLAMNEDLDSKLLELVDEVLSPEADVRRLIRAAKRLGGSGLGFKEADIRRTRPNRVLRRCINELRKARTYTEFLLVNASMTEKSLEAYLHLARRVTRATVRWEGPNGREDCFRATPVGAVFLSALYGVLRGRLRYCQSCVSYVVFPQQGFERKVCDRCRALRAATVRPERASGLPLSQGERWRRVLGRMRRRGFKRLKLLEPHKRRQWKLVALASLAQCRTTRDLDAWEKRVAPFGAPGRPRTIHVAQQESGGQRARVYD